jgi:hypothetical protein
VFRIKPPMCFSKEDAGSYWKNLLFILSCAHGLTKTLVPADFLVDAMDYAMSGFWGPRTFFRSWSVTSSDTACMDALVLVVVYAPIAGLHVYVFSGAGSLIPTDSLGCMFTCICSRVDVFVMVKQKGIPSQGWNKWTAMKTTEVSVECVVGLKCYIFSWISFSN